MKFSKKTKTIFVMLILSLSLSVVHAQNDTVYISAPIESGSVQPRCYTLTKSSGADDTFSVLTEGAKISNYSLRKQRIGKYMVVINSGSSILPKYIITATAFGKYLIEKLNSEGAFDPVIEVNGTPELTWELTPIGDQGKALLHEPKIYISRYGHSQNFWVVSKKMSLFQNDVYNCIISSGVLGEFIDIMTFLAAFLFV